ncbi:MAG: carbon-nitrogen hydrolase family protein [Pseudomonadota bacterium]
MARIAVLQMTSGIDPEANYAVISQAAVNAREAGAAVLFTPEMALLLDRDRKRASGWIDSDAPDRMLHRLAELQRELGLAIAIGSMPVAGGKGRWLNRSFFFGGNPEQQQQHYDKIHMFDVKLSTGEEWQESSAYEPGNRIVTIEETPVGRLGLTVCYDLRFPAMFQALAARRCDAIAVPAAFTVPTGKAHWHILLRARAIEASAFVIAAAQVGSHEDGRETYGHSLVVDPWGEVLLDMGGDGPDLGFCDVDLNRVEEVRSQLPSLANAREIPN